MSTPLHIHSSRTPAFLRRRSSRRCGVSASCPIRLWLVSEEQHTISISPLKFTAVACCQRSARARWPFNFTTVVCCQCNARTLAIHISPLSCVANATRAHWPYNFTTVVCCQCNARTLAIHIPLASAPPRTHTLRTTYQLARPALLRTHLRECGTLAWPSRG